MRWTWVLVAALLSPGCGRDRPGDGDSTRDSDDTDAGLPDTVATAEDLRIDRGGAAEDPDSHDPRMCVTDDGRVTVVWIDDRDGTTDVWLNRSAELGAPQTWMAEALRVHRGAFDNLRNLDLACADASLAVAWEDHPDPDPDHTRIGVATSLDGGDSWEVSYVDGDAEHRSMSLRPRVVAVGTDLYVAWFDGRHGAYDILLTHSGDAGQTWRSPVRVDTGLPAGSAWSGWPQIAATPSGIVYVVWEDTRSGDRDIHFARVEEAGITAQHRLDGGDDPGSADSVAPRLAASGDAVTVVWHDDRNGERRDVFLNHSGDGGVGWLAEARRIDSDNAGFFDSLYPTVATDGAIAHVTWHDARWGAMDVYHRAFEGGEPLGPEVRLDLGDEPGLHASTGVQIALGADHVVVAWQDARGESQSGLDGGYDDLFYNSSAAGSFSGGDLRLSNLAPGTSTKVDLTIAVHGTKLLAAWADGRSGTSDILFRALEIGTAAPPPGPGQEPAVANPRPPQSSAHSDRAVQAGPERVDVLFVVDNSCSMIEEQTAMAEDFPVFLDALVEAGIDYHIGVVSTDMVHPAHSGRLQEADGYRYISPETVQPVQVFAQMVVLGVDGHWDERGRDAAYTALAVIDDGYNAGFLREQADLHVVAVSDEDDKSVTVSVSEFVLWLTSLKEGSAVSFSSVVSPSPVCPSALEPGYDYVAITDAVGGIPWSICTADWGAFFQQLGLLATQRDTEFFMSLLPMPGMPISVVVTEDLTDFVFFEGVDWTWSPTANSVRFSEYIPSAQATVTIGYELRDGPR